MISSRSTVTEKGTQLGQAEENGRGGLMLLIHFPGKETARLFFGRVITGRIKGQILENIYP